MSEPEPESKTEAQKKGTKVTLPPGVAESGAIIETCELFDPDFWAKMGIDVRKPRTEAENPSKDEDAEKKE